MSDAVLDRFDAITVTVAGGVLLVSDQANGTAGFHDALMAYHGRPIRPPQRPDWRPAPGPPRVARAGGVQGRGAAPPPGI